MAFGELEWAHMNRIDLAQDRGQCKAVVNTVMKRLAP
jgi:hypothetical protein